MRGGVSVAEALGLPALRNARLLAGAEGIHRAIRHVDVMEVPDILRFVKAGELLLTSGYPIKDDPRSLEELIPQLAERDLAALAIAPHPYMGTIPQGAIASGDAHAFPIIELPDQASFNEIIAAVLEPILDRTREERHRAVLLDELVSGHPIDERELIEHATALGWDLAGPRTVIVAEMRDRAGHEVLVAGQSLEGRVSAVIASAVDPRTIAWARRAGLALIADATEASRPRTLGRAVARSLAAALPELTVAGGVGSSRSRAGELHASYREAVQALAIARELGASGAALSFDELGLYRVLHAVPAHELRRYCDDLLGPLVEHDRAHGSDLLRTLEAYLRNDRNVAASARELFIHYNTLRYRLGKIDELIGGLDRTQTARLSVEVAIHASRMLDAAGLERF